MDKTSPMQSKPLVNVTCKLGKKGCFEDGRCHALGNCENKITTHGDQIRAMNDEELAKLIYEADSLGYCKNLMECVKEEALGDAIPDDRCIACTLAWLRQPVEEDT